MFLLSLLERQTAGYLYTNASAQTLAEHLMRFTDTKSEALNLRASLTFKQVLKEAADHGQRSMVNMLEVLQGATATVRASCPSHPPLPLSTHKRAHADRGAHVGVAV